MSNIQIPFSYTIKNGVLLAVEDTIYINQEETQILGVSKQVIFRNTLQRFLLKRTALFIKFRDNTYGSEKLSAGELVNMFKSCCTPAPVKLRLHANEFDIEFE